MSRTNWYVAHCVWVTVWSLLLSTPAAAQKAPGPQLVISAQSHPTSDWVSRVLVDDRGCSVSRR